MKKNKKLPSGIIILSLITVQGFYESNSADDVQKLVPQRIRQPTFSRIFQDARITPSVKKNCGKVGEADQAGKEVDS